MAQSLSEISQLEAEAQIRFVGAEAAHRFFPGQTLKGSSDLDAFQLSEKQSHHSLYDADQVFGPGKRHFDVELGKLWLPVSPQIFVPETFDYLEIAVETAHHQDLFEKLGRLPQCVKLTPVNTARHQIIARPFRSALGQHRSLDIDKAMHIQIVTYQLGHPIT